MSYIDFTVIFVVRHPEKPVFFMEIKPEGSIHSRSARKGADRQMRARFGDFIESVDIVKFYGVSAIGANVCIYTQDRGTGYILPEFIPNDRRYSIDVTPANRWDLNVLTPQGEEMLRNVATHVKYIVADILFSILYI